MAYIVTDGFDLYREAGDMALRGWTQIPAGAGFVPGFYNHGRALRIPNLASAVFARRDFTGATELYVAVDVLLDSLPTSANRLLSLFEGATDQINVLINTTGTLAVRRTTTTLATSTGALLANTRYRLELRALNADAGGIAEVRIDGAVFVTFTGDTRNGGTGVMNRLELWGPTRSDGVGFTHYDNLTINTASAPAPTGYPGARRIETLLPNATLAEGFSRSNSALAPHELVGEGQLDATSFVSSATPGARDEYGLSDLSGTPSSIDAVVLVSHAARSDPGARSLRANLLSGSARALGATVSPPVSPSGSYSETILHADPNTSAAWTPAAVNAARAEVEIVA
jgi:hypothetical protein